MTNYSILKNVEQMKDSLRESVTESIFNDIISDYDLHVTDTRTGKQGYVESYNDDDKHICFIVPNEDLAEYYIKTDDFNEHFQIKLNHVIKQKISESYITCILCHNKIFDEDDIITYKDKPYTCYDCIEQIEQLEYV